MVSSTRNPSLGARVSTPLSAGASDNAPASEGVASSPTQSLDRAFLLLGVIAGAEADLGVSELARRSGLAKSTVARLLRSLRDLGAVELTPAGGHRVGPVIGDLAAGRAGSPDLLRQLARPALLDLAETLGEHTTLMVLQGDDLLYLDQVLVSTAVDAGDWTGEVHPPHAAAGGQVLMADWPAKRFSAYLASSPVAFTDSTPTTRAELRQRVDELDVNGVVWSVDEFADGVTGCAAPILDGRGVAVASIGAFAPSYRFPGETSKAAIGELIVAAAAETSRLLEDAS